MTAEKFKSICEYTEPEQRGRLFNLINKKK